MAREPDAAASWIAPGGPPMPSLTPLDPWIAGIVAAESPGESAHLVAAEAPRGPAGPPRPPAAGTGRLDRGRLEAYQLRRVRETVALAQERGSFYRNLLSRTGGAASIDSLDDLARLPLTTAVDLRANPLAFLCVSQAEIRRVVTLQTTGTTGSPKRLFFTEADQALTVAFFEVGMSTFTRPGDRVLILLPGRTPGSVGDLLGTALANIGAEPVPHGLVEDPGRAARIARDAGVTVMVGVPTQVLGIVRASPDASMPRVHSILMSTDHVPMAIARAVTAAWGCRVYNHWGMTETGLGGGVDCEARRGYHVREADLLIEVLDPATGIAVADGEPGEIVLTTLTRVGMPLVRYRTGDVGRWIPGRCPCGTRLRTLAHVTTRLAGIVDLGGGLTLTQADLDEALFPIEGVMDFSSRLRFVDGRRALRVELLLAPAAVRGAARALASARRAVGRIPSIARSRTLGTMAMPDVSVGTQQRAVSGGAKRAVIIEE